MVNLGEKHSGLLKFYLTQSAYKIGEVVVTGDSASIANKVFDKPISTMSLTPQEVNAIPKVIESDLLRALQTCRE